MRIKAVFNFVMFASESKGPFVSGEQQKEKGYEDDYEETTGALAMAHENCMLAKLSTCFSVLSSHLTSTNSRIDFSLGRMEWNGMPFQNPAMIDACKTWEVEKRHMQDAGM
jgi:hypothetical protein